MTSVLFDEYVRSFDQMMHGRRVLLVVDNCPAHPRNIEGLRNVELFFLPPNMTSKIQPCDMDIDNLMNYPGENEACSEVQSLEDIVGTIIENNAEDDDEDDTVSLEPVTRKEALMTSNTLHNFMIQYKNTTPELLNAIRKVRDELRINLNFKGK
ncbi:tigger transposable element-derived protein 6-like [Glycine soja]|uniref:tigger transposable element-derived protein 6-like n=1 Tax=Glycine soja TaxID=3848 RepID=UPI00103E13CE|nr:tigger transposable element-derived protein 6-like [Glycine soja]